tara:strand:+ start:2226 stop:2792 length:567 start_codon:yes stop_codon:yes gene_type:complete
MDSIKKFKYRKIKNFLTTSEVSIFKDYCRIKHRLNRDYFDTEQSSNLDTAFYADYLTESLLINKHSEMEKITGLSLKPTYSYWRMYTKFSDLEPHTDRPACEISVTINLGGDGTSWPIFMDKKPINLDPGDAAIYLGCELRHWREEFEGDWQAQAFLHYVDAEGLFADHWKDKRMLWGTPPMKPLKTI